MRFFTTGNRSGVPGASTGHDNTLFVQESIPRRCLFTARSSREQVVLDAMGCSEAGRIAKRDVVEFLRSSIEPSILLHPDIITNSRISHALEEFLKTYTTGTNALEYPSPQVQHEVSPRRKIVKTLYAELPAVIAAATPIMDRVESLSFTDSEPELLTYMPRCEDKIAS